MIATLTFREGSPADLAATFALSERALHHAAARLGLVSASDEPSEDEVAREWRRQRRLIEFLAGQPETRYWVCDDGERPVGYARVACFGEMEELTELMVDPDHQGRGIGKALLQRCWPGDPTPDCGRVVIAAGGSPDLSLYTTFGVMPVTGHWHMRQRTEAYVERRSLEIDAVEPAVHLLEPARAVAEWQRLEPAAIAHHRPLLHEFFGRDRVCLAVMDARSEQAVGLCWVGSEAEIGPAVGAQPADLVPVVLAALDRVAKVQAPEELSVFSTTISWWLLRRLRGLGFRVWWPSWILCSMPLPGLDRYMPTKPPHLL